MQGVVLKIYTKTGDKGTTLLATGERVSKADMRIESYGTVDELNALVGLLHDKLTIGSADFSSACELLQKIQHELFSVGSTLAGYVKLPLSLTAITDLVEKQIDEMQAVLPELRNFILPGGHEFGSVAHLTRTVCRRAERGVVKLNEHQQVQPEIIPFLNRLSDYFFVLSRFIVLKMGGKEVKWQGR